MTGDGWIARTDHGSIVELRLERKPANALNSGACAQWASAVRDAVSGGAEAVVLSGTSGVFSAGADLKELAAADRAGIADFGHALGDLAAEIARSRVPIAAALTGHCLGAATAIALQCDARVMAAGPYRFRLNYVAMGLVPPVYVTRALELLVGRGRAARLVLGAVAVSPDDARALGIVERTVDGGAVVEAAVEWCRQLLALPRTAMLETRRRQRAQLVAETENRAHAVDELVERWFGPEVQARLAKAVH